jgi:hypothetical protein
MTDYATLAWNRWLVMRRTHFAVAHPKASLACTRAFARILTHYKRHEFVTNADGTT